MIESKAFYRKIEQTFAGVGTVRSRERLAQRLASRVLEQLGGPLGLDAVHVYEPRKSAFTLVKRVGAPRPDQSAELARRFEDPGEGGIHELPWVGPLGPVRVGLIAVGGADGPLLALFTVPPGDLKSPPSRAELSSALASLLYAMRQHEQRRELEDLFEQSRAIQLSLLPEKRPRFADFDICAASVPAQSVGGDLYDFLQIDGETLGLAVADASGHGLPAALQARDVATGLRMGVERDFKITRMVERLNRVIHRSGLSTRFISLVFGELEKNGNFSYINAGHPPGLLMDESGVRELTVGGMVLGPDPNATYKLGFAHVDRGAVLALYTDGVVERGTENGKPFGMDGVRVWMQNWWEGPAEAAVEDLLKRLAEHWPGEPFEDDVTVMFVRRPA